MPSKLERRIIQSCLPVPLFLLILCVLAYGLLIPTLGFYWDDWPYAYINHLFGPSGYPDFVALDRPYSAWIFMGLTVILGERHLGYHISALLLFWACVFLFWYLLRLLWPQHKNEALWASLLFAVYPGFLGHPQAIIYNHHFIGMALYLFSFIGMVRAIKVPLKGCLLWRKVAWHLPALGALVLSQFSIEYFLGWEAIRPIVIWIALKQSDIDLERRIGRGIMHMTLYWLSALGFLVWRIFIFGFPTYQPLGGEETKFVLRDRLMDFLLQILETVFVAWGRAFPRLSNQEFSQLFWLAYIGLIGLTTGFVFIVLYVYSRKKSEYQEIETSRGVSFGRYALLIAFVGIVFAGLTFWLTDLKIDIWSTFYSRFTMPFMPWVALLFTVVLHYLFRARLKLPTLALIAMLIGGSTGFHFWNANFYRNEWVVLQRYFQQMIRRIPGLVPGTSLVINDLRSLTLYQDDSLTAIMNWTYAPDNATNELDYMVQYLSVRLGDEIPALKPGQQIEHPIRSLHFSGSTDQILVVYYEPPGCLRVLDDAYPERLPDEFPAFMLPALPLSNLSIIETSPEEEARPPANLFDAVPGDTWCFYFEEAELAAQIGDWARAAELGDKAFYLKDQSNEVTELFVFIEAFLRTGQLESALFASEYLHERSGGSYDGVICDLWKQVEGEQPELFGTDYKKFCP
ncbi:MAG: hypothetical protein SCH68_02010 [Brevefilum sp.]|nr:hypothetical protein [Brevefilum sp.]